jgi:IS1 family transposase
MGDRSEKTCRELWHAIPEIYRSGYCSTDFWDAYQAVIPEKQHTAVGKETGETAHVERWNNTLRQRLGRFIRKTLSFSKSPLMHAAADDSWRVSQAQETTSLLLSLQRYHHHYSAAQAPSQSLAALFLLPTTNTTPRSRRKPQAVWDTSLHTA